MMRTKLWFKRPAALVLAFIMVLSMVPMVSARAESAVKVSLGDLVADYYGSQLTDAEKTILESGALHADIDLVYSYEAPPAETADGDGLELISVVEDSKLVKVKAFEDSEGNTWVPVSFDIQVEGAAVSGNDDLSLTYDDVEGLYTGTYTYDDNMFSVVATYTLSIEASSTAITKLMDAVAAVVEDVEYMDDLRNGTCYSITVQGVTANLTVEGVLNNLVVDISELGVDTSALDGITVDGAPVKTAVDLIYLLAVEGIVYDLPEGYEDIVITFTRKANRDAAKRLYEQQNENGKLDLAKFLAEHAALSELEILAKHASELEEAIDSTRDDIDKIVNGELVGIADDLKYIRDNDLPEYEAEADEIFEEINAKLAENADMLEEYGLPTSVTKDNLDEVIAKFEEADELVLDKVNEELAPYADTLEIYGLPSSVGSADEVNSLVSGLQSKYESAMVDLNVELNSYEDVLEENGIAVPETITSAAELKTLIEDIEAKEEAALEALNTELDGYEALLEENGITVPETITSAEQVKTLSNDIEAAKSDALKALNDELTANEQVLTDNGIDVPAIVGSADLQTLINTLAGKKASAIADVNSTLLTFEEVLEDNGWDEVPVIITTADLGNLAAQLEEKLDKAIEKLNEEFIAQGLIEEEDAAEDVDDVAKIVDEKVKTTYDSTLADINNNLLITPPGAPTEITDSEDLTAWIEAAENSAFAGALAAQLAALKAARDALESAEKLFEAIEALEKLDEAVQGMKAAHEALVQLDEVVSMLETVCETLKKLEDAIAGLSEVYGALKTLDEVIPMLWNAHGAVDTVEKALLGLESAQDALEALTTAVDGLKQVRTALEMLSDAKAALGQYISLLEMLIEILDSVVSYTEDAADRFDDDEWNILEDAILAADADYTTVSAAAKNIVEVSELNPEASVVFPVATADVKYNMSMYDVTVKVAATEANADNTLADLIPVNGTKTYRAGEIKANIEAFIESIHSNALAGWNLELAHYDVSMDDLDALLTEGTLASNITFNIVYTPKQYTISFGEGFDGAESISLYYEAEYILPKHSEEGMAYSYTVIDALGGETRMNQGKVVTVTGPLTITRAAGSADQYKTVTDLMNNTGNTALGSFLESEALDQGQSFWLVTPTDGNELIGYVKLVSDNEITAETVDSEVGELVWNPVTATTYDENGAEIETVDFENGVATVTDNAFAKVEVAYKLSLDAQALAEAGLSTEKAVAQMNLQDTLAKEYLQQKAGLESLLTKRNEMKKIGENASLLGNALYLDISAEAKAVIQSVIDQMKQVEQNSGKPNLLLYTLLLQCDTNEDGKVDNMTAFYQNCDDILDEVEFVKNLVAMVEADPNLKAVLENNNALDMFMQLKAIMDVLSIPATNEAIDTRNFAALDALVAKIAAAAATVNPAAAAPYTEKSLDGLVWTAVVEKAGAGNVTVIVKYGVGSQSVSGSVTFKVGATLGEADIAKLDDVVAGLKAAYIEKYGVIDETHYTEVKDLFEEGHLVELADEGKELSVNWEAKTYTVKIDGEADQTLTYADPSFTLPGTGSTEINYVYTVGDTEYPVSVNDQKITIGKDKFDVLFAEGVLVITRETIDIARQKLIEFADSIDAVLIDNNGAYSIVLPVSGGTAAMDSITAFAMGLLMDATYSEISLGGSVLKDSDKMMHMQALVDAILYSGVGTDTLIAIINEDGSINHMTLDGEVIGAKNPAALGGKLIATTMGLDNTEVNFYITLVDADKSVVDARNTIAGQSYVSVVCENGAVNVKADLPDAIYEAYLCALTLTDEAELRTINDLDAKVALAYLFDLLNPILTDDAADIKTIENTLAKFGQSVAFSNTEIFGGKTVNDLYKAVMSHFNPDDLVYGESSVALNVENQDINSLIDSLQPIVDEKIAAMGVGGVEIKLANLIYEYKLEGESEYGLSFSLGVDIADAGNEYAALVIDLQADGYTNKLDLVPAESIAAEVNAIAGYAFVMLLENITVDALSFSTTAVLDLNGKTVTGDIHSTSNLIIVDSNLVAGTVGTVNGDVTGTATITGGSYSGDVSAFLSTNYVQDETGLVTGTLYTISESDGVITVTLNATNTNAEGENLLSKANIVPLAAEIVADLIINYYPSAAITIDGNTVYAIQAEDLVGLLSGGDELNSAIDTALTWISAPELAELVNTVIEDLSDFATLAAAVENGEPVVSYEVGTSKWNLALERVADGNYITANIGASEIASTKTLEVVVDSKLKDEIVVLLEALADTTTVEAAFSAEDIVRDPATNDFVLSGTFEGAVVMDFRHDPAYLVMMASVLAKGCPAVKSAMVKGINEYYDMNSLVALEKAFDELTVSQLVAALKDFDRSAQMSSVIAGLGLSENAKTKALADVDNTAKGFDLAIDAMGVALRKLDLSTVSTKALGAIKKTDENGDYYYGANRGKLFDGSREVYGNYGLDYSVDISNISIMIYLFPDHVCVFDREVAEEEFLASEATCTEAATYYYSCACGEAGTETFTYGEANGHDWVEVVEEEYLASEATCTEPAKYYLSCSVCGEAGTETFTYGEVIEHNWVEVVAPEYLKSEATTESAAVYWKSCSVCGEASETETFTYGEPIEGLPEINEPALEVGDGIYGCHVDTENKLIRIDTKGEGLTVEELKAALSADMENDADGIVGVEVSLTINYEGRALIPTSAKVTLTAENSAGKDSVEYVIIILGDTNCNGRIDSGDARKMSLYFFGEVELDAYQLLAADTNQNGGVDAGDARRNEYKYISPEDYETALQDPEVIE